MILRIKGLQGIRQEHSITINSLIGVENKLKRMLYLYLNTMHLMILNVYGKVRLRQTLHLNAVKLLTMQLKNYFVLKEIDMKFIDKRGREWEVFVDHSYYD